MNTALSVVFFEEYFVCTILPNGSAWEILRPNGVEKLPLYFYVSGGNVRNDAFAKERFEANDTAAFGNFYETILDKSRTFRRFDLELDPIELLHDLIQQVKSAYFERMRAFDDQFDSASEIPLNLCFIPGIHRDAKERIRAFLVGQGFSLNSEADYLEAFIKSLQRKAIIHGKISLAIVEMAFGDLWFHYLECNDGIVKRESEVIVGKGVDHRVGNLARLFVEKAARQKSSRILHDTASFDQEVKRFHRRAAAEIDRFEYDQLDLKIELSDFSSARVIVDRRELDRMSAESFQLIKFRFESFISRYSNLARTEKILLTGDLLASNESVQFFERTFGASKVIRPLDNVVEMLSRGIAAMASDDGVSKRLDIVIHVTAEGFEAAEPPTAPPRPPMIVRPPSVPPRPDLPKPGRSVGSPETDRKVAAPPLAAKPPLPPASKAPAVRVSVDVTPPKPVSPPKPVAPPKPVTPPKRVTPPNPPKAPPPVPPMPPAKGNK